MPAHRRGALKDTLAAIYGLLNVSALTSVATGGVHHGQAPENEVRDYVVIQSPESARWDAMQQPGEEGHVDIAAVTLGPDAGPAMAALNVVIQLLDGEQPAITNHLCVSLKWERSQVLRDPEIVNGKTSWRAIGSFRTLVDQTA